MFKLLVNKRMALNQTSHDSSYFLSYNCDATQFKYKYLVKTKIVQPQNKSHKNYT